MQRETFVNKQGAHQAKELSKAKIQVVGAVIPPGYFLSTENTSHLSGISVGKIALDQKTVYTKLELDGVRLDNLPATGPKPTTERREWSVSL